MLKAKRHGSARTSSRPVTAIDPSSHEATAAAVARLASAVERQARVIRDDKSGFLHSREVFERASAAARLGVWECDLSTQKLQWSDGTYDLFGIARGTPLLREQVLPCYPEQSLRTLERVRSRALSERNGFTLDAEIVARDRTPRVIRITACVERAGSRPARLFGIKQDVTEQKTALERLRRLAEVDQLTGLANRARFDAALETLCSEAPPGNTGALLLVDLDGFKTVNDSLGHAAGDECLRQAAHRLAAVCSSASLVARIGGDEFAVVLDGPALRARGAGRMALDIVEAMTAPLESCGGRFSIGASVGIARVGGASAGELVARADAALYAAKAGGRKTYRWYEPRLRSG